MKGKHFAKAYWSRTRIVSAILSIALLFGCITFSSAWLIAKNEPEGPVVNKFTGSKLEITLTPNEDQGPYKLIPGMTYDLGEDAPVVTVEAGSVECYLFVVIDEKGTKINGEDVPYFYPFATEDFPRNYTTTFNYSTSGWLSVYSSPDALDRDDNGYVVNRNVYCITKQNGDATQYFIPNDNENDQTFKIMEKVTVGSDTTKDMVAPSNFNDNNTPPAIKITAYSIQTLGFKGKNGSDVNDVKAAWAVVEEAIRRNNTKEVVLN